MVLVYTQIEKRASLKTKRKNLRFLSWRLKYAGLESMHVLYFFNLQLPRVKQQVTKIVNC